MPSASGAENALALSNDARVALFAGVARLTFLPAQLISDANWLVLVSDGACAFAGRSQLKGQSCSVDWRA
eukprot:519820-Pyramimonas_sp.AAC.1